jgi:large subunit ribosomal protein L28
VPTDLPDAGGERSVNASRRSIQTEAMAKRCEICGKGPVVGRNISHAHNVTPRRFEPNLQRVRALVNGGIQRLRVCTRCLRSGKVVKAA